MLYLHKKYYNVICFKMVLSMEYKQYIIFLGHKIIVKSWRHFKILCNKCIMCFHPSVVCVVAFLRFGNFLNKNMKIKIFSLIFSQLKLSNNKSVVQCRSGY